MENDFKFLFIPGEQYPHIHRNNDMEEVSRVKAHFCEYGNWKSYSGLSEFTGMVPMTDFHSWLSKRMNELSVIF